MNLTYTFYGWEVRTRVENRKTITTITLRGEKDDFEVCRVVTRGNRHRAQHRRLVAFAEHAESRVGGFNVDPMVVHEVAMGRGAFA